MIRHRTSHNKILFGDATSIERCYFWCLRSHLTIYAYENCYFVFNKSFRSFWVVYFWRSTVASSVLNMKSPLFWCMLLDSFSFSKWWQDPSCNFANQLGIRISFLEINKTINNHDDRWIMSETVGINAFHHQRRHRRKPQIGFRICILWIGHRSN